VVRQTARMEDWRKPLKRWTDAQLIDAATAERIEQFEGARRDGSGLEWPVLVALIFGGIALGAGILLFVAAHWDYLPPEVRFALVLLMLALLNLGGFVAAAGSSGFRSAFHALATIAFGAAIFLTGQIFHMSSSWASGMALWAIGSFLAWWLIRDTPQTILLALIAPTAFAAEYTNLFRGEQWGPAWGGEWGAMIALTYISAATRERHNTDRMALVWVGSLGLFPVLLSLSFSSATAPPAAHTVVALAIAIVLAWLLHGEGFWIVGVFDLWVIVYAATMRSPNYWRSPLVYVVCAIGSAGMVWWGLQDGRKERINLGIAGFALTVIDFYISSVLDKLGRSASLIGLGALLLAGGWFLERTRRNLLARV
jgi:uncharacterized membrane protein